MSADKEFQLTIDGKAVATKKHFPVINPATEEVVAQCPQADIADLDAAVAAARAAFADWSGRADEERIAMLQEIGKLFEAHEDEIARIITAEQGKCLSGPGARFEAGACAGWAHVTAGLSLPVEELVNTKEERIEMHRLPVGVVASITPWNWPAMIAIWHIMPALRVGCTVIIKPSSYTPLSTLRLVELANQILPPGVLNVVTGDKEIGDAISAHPDIDKIIFTGSIATGRRVMERAGATLKKLTLELGGNDAGIILPGTNMSERLETLFWGCFINSGQTCACLKRLYVHADDYETLCAQFTDYLKNIPMGDGADEKNLLGPLSNEMQYKKVIDIVEDAKAKGGRILCGGEADKGKGYFYPLTLIADATADMRVVNEEQFGPVLPVIKYTDIEEAIAAANSLETGLGASVWGDDVGQAKAIAKRLQAGTVWVNRHASLNPIVPMGGIKQSGIGVEFGPEGLKEYTDIQIISTTGEAA